MGESGSEGRRRGRDRVSGSVISKATQRCEWIVLGNIRKEFCAIETRPVTGLAHSWPHGGLMFRRVPSTVSPWVNPRGVGVQVGHWDLSAKGMGTDRDGIGWCFVSAEQSCMVCDAHTGLVAFTMAIRVIVSETARWEISIRTDFLSSNMHSALRIQTHMYERPSCPL